MAVPKIVWSEYQGVHYAKVGKAFVGSIYWDDIQSCLVMVDVNGNDGHTSYRHDKISLVKKQVELSFVKFWENMGI